MRETTIAPCPGLYATSLLGTYENTSSSESQSERNKYRREAQFGKLTAATLVLEMTLAHYNTD